MSKEIAKIIESSYLGGERHFFCYKSCNIIQLFSKPCLICYHVHLLF